MIGPIVPRDIVAGKHPERLIDMGARNVRRKGQRAVLQLVDCDRPRVRHGNPPISSNRFRPQMGVSNSHPAHSRLLARVGPDSSPAFAFELDALAISAEDQLTITVPFERMNFAMVCDRTAGAKSLGKRRARPYMTAASEFAVVRSGLYSPSSSGWSTERCRLARS